MCKEYFQRNCKSGCACFSCLSKWLTGDVVFLIDPKFFNGKFYNLGEWLYHLYECHLYWLTCNREPDSFIFTSWELIFWSKHRRLADVIKCSYHGKRYVCQSKYACFCSFPQITYLHTKNEGGLKLFISNFALLSRSIALTALFNNMRTLKLKAQPTNAFFTTVNQMFGGSSQLPTMLSELYSTIWFDYRALGSSRKLGGTAENLIDGSEKRICRLRFEF